MKIGILTFHRAHNYGAFLQAYSLCNRLNQEDEIDAEIIDYRMILEKKRYDVKCFSPKKKVYQFLHGTYLFNKKLSRCFDETMSKNHLKLSSNALVSDSINKFRKFVDGKYDAIIVGSDEVWKVNSYRGFPTAYWLFGNLHCRKFSYAASARVSFHECLNDQQYSLIQKALGDFEFISVRDTITQNEVSAVLNSKKQVHLCCDPSFLYDIDVPQSGVLKRIQLNTNYKKSKKNILIMLDSDEAARRVQQTLGAKYNLISVFHPHKGFINCADVNPFEWLYLIKNTDFVIASFFHAICFSIVNNRPFIAVGTKGKKSKLTELLSTDELMKHYVEIDNKTDIEAMVHDISSLDNRFDHVKENMRATFQPFLHALLNDSVSE